MHVHKNCMEKAHWGWDCIHASLAAFGIGEVFLFSNNQKRVVALVKSMYLLGLRNQVMFSSQNFSALKTEDDYISLLNQ